MNIAFLLTPKSDVSFLYDDNTLRQCIERMKIDPHTAVPVINREGRYITTISEGDVLRWLIRKSEETKGDISFRDLEGVFVRELRHKDKNPPCLITEEPEDLVFRAMEQNFIPVVDDWGSFIGIVTRRDILKYLATSQDKMQG
ncbi:MAG: CBS domain-containing protein [Firmicutes bacterium]|nr:CBS domain-containing protein [Bacillota bacterium]